MGPLLSLFLGVLGGLVIAVVGSVVSYQLGAKAEKRRMKDGEVYRRLDAIHEAITHMSRIRASITGGQAEQVAGVPSGERRETAQQIGDLHAEGAGVIQDGHVAAEALEASDLAKAIAEALVLLGIAATTPRSDELVLKLGAKLTEIRHLYEALRKKLLG